jgi:hypothetical protein
MLTGRPSLCWLAEQLNHRLGGEINVSAKYCVAFLMLGVAFAGTTVIVWDALGVGALAFLYAALSFWLLSAAYAGLGPRVFLKRADGRLRPLAWLLFGPYLMLNALSFWLYRVSRKHPAYGMAAPNLFFGRRLTPGELRLAQARGWRSVLDLAPEFSEVRGLRAVPRYRSLPVLDGTTPTREQLCEAVAWVAQSVAVGPVYVHCALRHGRTATVVLAYLLATGEVATLSEGLARLWAQRPGVGLHRQQAELVCCWQSPAGAPTRPEAARGSGISGDRTTGRS